MHFLVSHRLWDASVAPPNTTAKTTVLLLDARANDPQVQHEGLLLHKRASVQVRHRHIRDSCAEAAPRPPRLLCLFDLHLKVGSKAGHKNTRDDVVRDNRKSRACQRQCLPLRGSRLYFAAPSCRGTSSTASGTCSFSTAFRSCTRLASRFLKRTKVCHPHHLSTGRCQER